MVPPGRSHFGPFDNAPVADTKRIRIALCCSVCSARNYKKTKARKDGGRPLQLKKFCNTCNAHTVHIEGK